MKIVKPAMAGTTESCDVQVRVEPNPGGGREIQLDSNVKTQFGDAIIATVQHTLDEFGLEDVAISLVDKGAFDWVIRARIQAAVCRAAEQPFNWKEVL